VDPTETTIIDGHSPKSTTLKEEWQKFPLSRNYSLDGTMFKVPKRHLKVLKDSSFSPQQIFQTITWGINMAFIFLAFLSKKLPKPADGSQWSSRTPKNFGPTKG